VRLILVRHGQTEGNVDRRLQGSEDPLTPLGRRQAQELAAHLAGRDDVTTLYASPYARARETAGAVGAALGLEPILREDLAELDVGDAVGYRYDDWAEAFPQEAIRFRTDGVDFAWPGGESGRQLGERVAREAARIIGDHRDDETVVVVSHGGALAWMLVYLLRQPGDKWPSEHLNLHNCSVTEVEVLDRESPATVVRHNWVDHLTPEPEAEAATGEDPD
jgi:ribonuclease H / adenosylcobalamin/alpha-ribazole phosphatase